MLIPREVFDVLKVAARESSRYAINGVLVERESDEQCNAVCTDGRRLLCLSWDDTEARHDYPCGDANSAPVEGFEWVINGGDWSEAKNLAPKNGGVKPVLQNVLLDEHHKPNTELVFVGTDLSKRRTLEVTPADCHFPKYRDVIPEYDDDDCVRIGVNPKLFAELLKVMADVATDEESKGVTLIVPKDPARPIRIEAEAASGVKATGVLMPVNLKA